MKFSCPSCSIHLQAEPDLAGKTVKCPGCGTKIQIPADMGGQAGPSGTTGAQPMAPPSSKAAGPPPPDAAASKKAPADAEAPAAGEEETYQESPAEEMVGDYYDQLPDLEIAHGGTNVDNANINMWAALAMGGGLTFFWLLVTYMLPADYYLRILFWERGWPQFVTTFLTMWSASILLLKYINLRKQKRAILVEALPVDISEEINVRNLPEFYQHVTNFPKPLRHTFIVTRIRKGLEFFYVRQSNPEVAQFLTSQSEIDAAQVNNSYSIIKVFLWAIPIMGFIGTVLGIGMAVGGFETVLSAEAGDADALKTSLTGVTGDLGVAFDTTLLALVFSILLSIPMAFMQKSEEDHIIEVDQYCIDNVLKRLNDGGAGGSSLGEAGLVKALGDAMAANQKDVLDKLKAVQAGMADSVSNQTRYFQEVAGIVDKQLSAIERRAKEYETRLDDDFFKTLDKIRTGSVDAISANVKPLAEGIQNLNQILKELNGKQVVVQKKGWFSRK